MAGLIYLASPYSHNSPAVREARYFAARSYAIQAMREGHAIISPIVYGKDMETQIGIDYKSWQPINDTLIRLSSALWVLQLYGWEISKGVAHEIRLAKDLNIPIKFVDPVELP